MNTEFVGQVDLVVGYGVGMIKLGAIQDVCGFLSSCGTLGWLPGLTMLGQNTGYDPS